MGPDARPERAQQALDRGVLCERIAAQTAQGTVSGVPQQGAHQQRSKTHPAPAIGDDESELSRIGVTNANVPRFGDEVRHLTRRRVPRLGN
jgi:hypothetical protein